MDSGWTTSRLETRTRPCAPGSGGPTSRAWRPLSARSPWSSPGPCCPRASPRSQPTPLSPSPSCPRTGRRKEERTEPRPQVTMVDRRRGRAGSAAPWTENARREAAPGRGRAPGRETAAGRGGAAGGGRVAGRTVREKIAARSESVAGVGTGRGERGVVAAQATAVVGEVPAGAGEAAAPQAPTAGAPVRAAPPTRPLRLPHLPPSFPRAGRPHRRTPAAASFSRFEHSVRKRRSRAMWRLHGDERRRNSELTRPA